MKFKGIYTKYLAGVYGDGALGRSFCFHQFIFTLLQLTSKDLNMATTRWENFFKDAGIPKAPATDYAMIFTDNRMRMDMLNELNKEILADLGMNVMGDVIAILRHSKKVYAEISRSAAAEFDVNRTKSTEDKRRSRLYDDLKAKTSTATKTSIEPEKKPVPALKALPKPAQVKSQKPLDKATIAAVKEKQTTKSLSDRFAAYHRSPAKKRKDDNDEIITISVPLDEEPKTRKVPVKEKRQPPKEKVEAPPPPPKKTTVFDRLGAASAEKDTRAEKEKAPSAPKLQKITRITPPSKSPPRKDTKSSNVFSRLGEASQTQSSSTTKSGLSARFAGLPSAKTTTKSTAVTDSSSTRAILTVDLSRKDSSRLGLGGSKSVPRPVKHVKPIPRKPLAMDSEPIIQVKIPKQTIKIDTGSKSQTSKKSAGKAASVSVFDRLGK
eukprot:Seg4963.1 transcript_id=Seg4963.1/GoldUCD/mRNA.D3Y31 product="putative protein C19orf47-like" protein_id=Seg4963.1/GoldUCD/D3Y31